MTEDELNEAICRAKRWECEENSRKAIAALAEFLYTRLNQFRVHCANDDVKSDYIVWMYPRFKRIIDRFDPGKASLRTYLGWVIGLSFRTFIRASYGQEANQRAYECEEATRILSVEAECGAHDVWVDGTADAEAVFARLPSIAEDAHLSAKKKEIRARTILLLACKSGCYLDESHIAKVAEMTDYDENYVRNTIERIQAALRKKTDRSKSALERKNGFYVRARRCAIEMRYLDEKTARYEKLRRERVYCQKRWQELCERGKIRVNSPSNRFLAATLGLSRGTVDATLATALQGGYDREP